MKKRIAIFCDGTWNRADAQHPTNVVRMAQTVRHTAEDGRKQHVLYKMGVGTGRGSNSFARVTDKIMGGAMGWGLIETIEETYRDLIFCYEPGDQLYIFGFSRGAYTARSLAGLIRYCGIPPRENVHRISEAIRRYRRPKSAKNHPDDPSNLAWRSNFSPFTLTSQAEFDWRMANKPGMIHPLEIAYLGVWDMVGALGVPGYWMAAPLLNRAYQFHDNELSSTIKSARHALAIDERRRAYAPTEMGRIDELNRRALDLPDGADLSEADRNALKYRQEWFPGDHGSVGGGGERKGLSAYAFDWMAEGAIAAGLDLRPEAWDLVRKERNIAEKTINKVKSGMMNQYLRWTGSDRTGPETLDAVSAVARDKVRSEADYRPKTLTRVMNSLLD